MEKGVWRHQLITYEMRVLIKPETEIGFTPPSSYERLWSLRLALILDFGLILRIFGNSLKRIKIHYFEVKSAYF